VIVLIIITILPPPPEVHNSADELFQNAQRFANSQGYALVKKRTQKDNRETHNRKTSTRLIDYPFELYATRQNGLWHLEVHNATYNHDPSNDMSGHPIVRQLTEEQKESVAIMTTSGSRPHEIISTLQQNDLSTLVISIDELQGGDFLYKYKCDNNGSVTHLFFAHKESVSLSRQYPTVILMDCEEEDDYKWALQIVISYLQETWIPWKKKFIKAWTNQLLYLGTTVTSHIEGSHVTLKAYLQTSTGDLHHVYTTISLAVTNQRKEFNTMIASERIRIPAFATYNSLYSNIRDKVSSFALNKINDQYQKAKRATAQEPLPSCTGTFTRTMGLPCAHFIQYLENNQNLMLNDIHKHYSDPKNPLQPLLYDLQQRYQEWPEFQKLVVQDTLKNLIDEPSMTLQNPNVVHTRGHLSGAPNYQKNNSTRRDPSCFEMVEHKGRHCAIC
ncbi:4956_t:CDS:2, partial [Scutellospora calospora]